MSQLHCGVIAWLLRHGKSTLQFSIAKYIHCTRLQHGLFCVSASPTQSFFVVFLFVLTFASNRECLYICHTIRRTAENSHRRKSRRKKTKRKEEEDDVG